MAETGITIKDAFIGVSISKEGTLVFSYDDSIDNVDFSINSNDEIVVQME